MTRAERALQRLLRHAYEDVERMQRKIENLKEMVKKDEECRSYLERAMRRLYNFQKTVAFEELHLRGRIERMNNPPPRSTRKHIKRNVRASGDYNPDGTRRY